MVSDIVKSSWDVNGEGVEHGIQELAIGMSSEVREVVNILRAFMFERVYLPEDMGEEGQAARAVIRLMYEYYKGRPEEIPSDEYGGCVSVSDYISGMTDQYALREAERIKPGVSGSLKRAIVL